MGNPSDTPQSLKAPDAGTAKARGGKKGAASGRRRRKWQSFRKLFELALTGRVEEVLGTPAGSIVLAMIQKAATGDERAFKEIRDTMGEKPTDRQEISGKDGEEIQIVCFDAGKRVPV